jgi:hypothetical protein
MQVPTAILGRMRRFYIVWTHTFCHVIRGRFICIFLCAATLTLPILITTNISIPELIHHHHFRIDVFWRFMAKLTVTTRRADARPSSPWVAARTSKSSALDLVGGSDGVVLSTILGFGFGHGLGLGGSTSGNGLGVPFFAQRCALAV